MVPLVGSCSSAEEEAEATARTQVVATRALLLDEVDMVVYWKCKDTTVCVVSPRRMKL